jgi:hypothetical protein
MRKRAPFLVALIIAIPGLWYVFDATRRASFTSLGRDQGIFQYVAWAVRQGDVLYRDIRDVNGPVVTMVHIVFQWLGGEDEHRFRSLDLLFTGLSFAIAGALIASKARLGERLAWALAAWTACSAQYLTYGFWDTAQRESFMDWFVLVSLALWSAADETRSRKGTILIAMAGMTSFIPWLGKPTFALFTLSQVAALLFERDRRRRLAVFLAGGAVGVLVPFVFMLAVADLRAWFRITFVDVPAMYRFIWPRPASVILTLPGYMSTCVLAALTSAGMIGLIARRILPPRMLPIAAMPVLGVVSMLVQAKGFPYHFHPITLGTTFAWVATAAALRNRWPLVTMVGATAIGVHAALLIRWAPYPPLPAPGEDLDSGARLAYFDRVDFFPEQFRQTAARVQTATKPTDRVQTYGMDAYLLFLARRLSATPYIYAYDLNVDAALWGAYDDGGIHPTEPQRAIIRSMRDAHIAELTATVRRAPPAAFVLVSRSPLMSSADAGVDFEKHCPEAAAYMHEHYTDLGGDPAEIWLRSDLVPLSSPAPPSPTEPE